MYMNNNEIKDPHKRLEEIRKEIRDEDRRQQQKEDKKSRQEAYAILFILFSSILMITFIFSGKPVPIGFALITLLGDIYSLHKLDVF